MTKKQATVEERWEIVNYSPYASHVDIYLGFIVSAFYIFFSAFCSHLA